MRNITERLITEKVKTWEFYPNIGGNDSISIPIGNAKYLLINTEGEQITAVTNKDLASFKDEFDDEETAKALKKLKLGESYDADGGINIYIRIK